MATAALAPGIITQPRLVFFHSGFSGACRRAEGFLAQVLQRRRNHETFKLYRVAQEERPDLVERFGITTLPTLVVNAENTLTETADQLGLEDLDQLIVGFAGVTDLTAMIGRNATESGPSERYQRPHRSAPSADSAARG